jgi:DMSO reductase anchor subunit
MTKHGRIRQQQRAVHAGIFDAVLTFGEAFEAGAGYVAYYLTKDASRRHESAIRSIIDQAQNVAIVVSNDGFIVSMQHVARPKRSWRP